MGNKHSMINPEGYPMVWVDGITSSGCGGRSFSKHPRPAQIPGGELYDRFSEEMDEHLSEINKHAFYLWGTVVLLVLALALAILFTPPGSSILPSALFVCLFVFPCVFSCWIRSNNATADRDIRHACRAYADEFRRATGYVPEYKTHLVRRRKGHSTMLRAFVFRPGDAPLEAVSTTADLTTTTTARTTTTITRTTTATARTTDLTRTTPRVAASTRPRTTARTTTTRIPVTTEAIEQLLSMGFEEEKVVEALRECDNDAERAADYLASSSTTDDAIPEAVAVLVEPPPPRTIKRLVDLGFGEAQAIEALENCDNDIERAAESLTNESAATTSPSTTTTTAAATHYVTVPPGITAGQTFRIELAGGRQFEVTCPPGSSAGSRIGVHVS